MIVLSGTAPGIVANAKSTKMRAANMALQFAQQCEKLRPPWQPTQGKFHATIEEHLKSHLGNSQ
jgi:hypothetical protein